MGTSKIEWTEATWNPVTGCTPISEGCEHCYAKRMATRLRGRCGYPAGAPFLVKVHPDRYNEPFGWRKPKKIFVCSMGDLFHEDVPFPWINEVFSVIQRCTHHRFMVLTKRPERMRNYISKVLQVRGWPESDIPFPNVWMGITAETQRRADERIPVLLEIPAARRFVSVEPMLGPVDLSQWLGRSGGLDWVICGGETGPGARPVHPDWVRSLRDQCQIAGVPFFFKSWGEWREANMDLPVRGTKFGCFMGDTFVPDYGNIFPQRYPEHINMARIGKSNAGRILDGRTWDEEPEDVNVSKEVR